MTRSNLTDSIDAALEQPCTFDVAYDEHGAMLATPAPAKYIEGTRAPPPHQRLYQQSYVVRPSDNEALKEQQQADEKQEQDKATSV